ncbi:MAG: hypothetical protein ABII82_05745 [Verrucomicrobiota bacterium]
MKQTCYLKPTVTALNALNDMLWFNRFNGHEVRGLIAAKVGQSSQQLTQDCFPDNPFAVRFNVSLADVLKQGSQHDEMLFRVVYGCSYEYFLRHCERMEELLRTCGNKPWCLSKKEESAGPKAPEDRFEWILSRHGQPVMDSRHTWTASYARLRRHQYFHAADSTWSKMNNLLATRGADLNRLWSDQKMVNRVDFTQDGLSGCPVEEAVGLLRMLRILTLEIDAHTIGLLDREKMVLHSLRHWIAGEESHGQKAGPGRVSRMVTRFRSELGIGLRREDVESMMP